MSQAQNPAAQCTSSFYWYQLASSGFKAIQIKYEALSWFDQAKSRITRRWAQKHPGTKSGKQEETPSPKEAGSVCACGRSASFVEPGWDECTSAQVWPRHQAVALFSELAVKDARSA